MNRRARLRLGAAMASESSELLRSTVTAAATAPGSGPDNADGAGEEAATGCWSAAAGIITVTVPSDVPSSGSESKDSDFVKR